MNTAAAAGFMVVMILGLAGLFGLVYRDRGRTAPAPVVDDPLDAEHWPPPATVYEQTVAAIGDPHHIDLNPPAFAW
jgi:hypothetical protein